jgi:hypothetical protein
MKKSLLFLISLTFVLNLVWENSQAFLYKGYENFWQHFEPCFIASFGDILIVGVLYLLVSVILRDFYWFFNIQKKHLILLSCLGGLIAVVIEWWALITLRWEYGLMPAIPILGVGVLPVLQMIIIPPITFLIAGLLFKKKENNL